MSSRREVLIRILALLQRKTLIETKNRTLKWHYWTVRSIKNVALLTEDGAFALCFLPHPGGFASSRVPTPGNLPSKAKKVLMPGGQLERELTAALTVNETISNLDHIAISVPNQLVFTFWEDLVCMADLSNIWKRLYHYKTTHPDVDRPFTSWFSSQMDIRKFALFVFLLNLGILPLTVKGMPLFFSS